jgi:hypothetical protein
MPKPGIAAKNIALLTFYGAVLLFVTNVVANSIVNEVQIDAQDGHVDQTRDSNDDSVETIFHAREDVQYKNNLQQAPCGAPSMS